MGKFEEIVALINDDPAKATELLTAETLRFRNSCGETLLNWFAVENQIEIVKLLIEKGVEIDAVNTGKRNALMEASMLGHTEMVRLLLEHGADPNFRTNDETPLRIALSSRQYEVAEILIRAGADPNLRDKLGETILFDAVRMEDIKLIRYILGRGGKPNIKNRWKETVLDIARENENQNIAELLISVTGA